jgi:hypothetical protein
VCVRNSAGEIVEEFRHSTTELGRWLTDAPAHASWWRPARKPSVWRVSPSNTSTTFGWWRRRSSVRSASDSRTGLGIGLAFSRWGAEANAGRLYARNLPDQGCAFTVDLPRSSVPAVALV